MRLGPLALRAEPGAVAQLDPPPPPRAEPDNSTHVAVTHRFTAPKSPAVTTTPIPI